MQSKAKQLGIKFFMKTYVIKKIIKIWKMGLYLGVIRSVKGMYFWKKWVCEMKRNPQNLSVSHAPEFGWLAHPSLSCL